MPQILNVEASLEIADLEQLDVLEVNKFIIIANFYRFRILLNEEVHCNVRPTFIIFLVIFKIFIQIQLFILRAYEGISRIKLVTRFKIRVLN